MDDVRFTHLTPGRSAAGVPAATALVVALALVAALPVAAAQSPVVALAASVRPALEDVARAFHQKTGIRVRLSSGSSGNLARRIRQGAPYALFLSADPAYVRELNREGLTRDAGKTYLLGRLALVVASGSPIVADSALSDLGAALDDGRLRRFAIANPEHAPYGRRAEEALRRAGLWQRIVPRLVLGENVAQATQFAVSGNAEGGLVGAAVARAAAAGSGAALAVVPAEWHAPLEHRAVALRNAGPAAIRFYAFLSAAAAARIFRRHGFDLPGGAG